MRPVLIGDPTEAVVKFSLTAIANGVALVARDEAGNNWVVARILPSGMQIMKGIPEASGIPVDATGHIASSKEA